MAALTSAELSTSLKSCVGEGATPPDLIANTGAGGVANDDTVDRVAPSKVIDVRKVLIFIVFVV